MFTRIFYKRKMLISHTMSYKGAPNRKLKHWTLILTKVFFFLKIPAFLSSIYFSRATTQLMNRGNETDLEEGRKKYKASCNSVRPCQYRDNCTLRIFSFSII